MVRLRVQREGDVASVGDLLVYSLDELEAVAAEKGGIRQLLDEKWRKVYKAAAPRGLFTRGEMRAAYRCAPADASGCRARWLAREPHFSSCGGMVKSRLIWRLSGARTFVASI